MRKKEGMSARGRALIALSITALALAAAVVSYMLMRSGTPGMHFAFYLVLGCSALVILYMIIWWLGAYTRLSRLSGILRRSCTICVAAGIVCFIVLECIIIAGARSDDEAADCVIVLGAGLYGEWPSAPLASRLDAALEYLEAHDGIPVIVSGGQGPGETITEAEAMRRYLVRHGIDENRIHMENKSTSTFENFAFSRALMEQIGLDPARVTVAVVTSEFHLYRSRYIAGRTGLDVVGVAAETHAAGLRALYYCREAIALVHAFLFGG